MMIYGVDGGTLSIHTDQGQLLGLCFIYRRTTFTYRDVLYIVSGKCQSID